MSNDCLVNESFLARGLVATVFVKESIEVILGLNEVGGLLVMPNDGFSLSYLFK